MVDILVYYKLTSNINRIVDNPCFWIQSQIIETLSYDSIITQWNGLQLIWTADDHIKEDYIVYKCNPICNDGDCNGYKQEFAEITWHIQIITNIHYKYKEMVMQTIWNDYLVSLQELEIVG